MAGGSPGLYINAVEDAEREQSRLARGSDARAGIHE